ncbi:unnamed protein product, partial [marine sediment metagenome]
VKKCGGRNIKLAPISGQVFCDLDDAGASKLQSVPGLAVKLLKRVKSQDTLGGIIPPEPGPGPLEVPIYASSQVSLASELFYLRSALDPPITGKNITIAILDSGIRHTHEGLKNKVIYEANFSNSPTCEDIFDHGTGVAYCAVGGRHSVGEEGGAAPGAQVWNIKVLDDNGEGDEENVVMAIEHCIDRKRKLMESGLLENDPQIANFMNLSWGAPDDGDPDNPIRLVCKAAFEARIGSVVAAGNGGPAPGSLMSPACDLNTVAVGAVTFVPFEVWEFSSRGPTKEGLIKPDVVFYGIFTSLHPRDYANFYGR